MRHKKTFAIAVLCMSFLGCKRYDIKPISLPMYRQEYQVDAYDRNSISNNCYITLNGHHLNVEDIGSGTIEVDYGKIDLGYANGTLTTPGSKEANDLFTAEYASGNSNVNTWPIRNNGLFSITKLSKATFDTLTHIESILPLAQTADQTTVQLAAGQVIVYNLSRSYGLLYVNSASQGNADMSMKYLLINP
jgi:hypothetical protein